MIARLPQRIEPLAYHGAVEKFGNRGQSAEPHDAVGLRDAAQLRDAPDIHQRRLELQAPGFHLRHQIGAAGENRDVSRAQDIGRFIERSWGSVAMNVGHSRYLEDRLL